MEILSSVRLIFGISLTLFWGTVIVHLISRQREIKQIQETAKCTNCGHDDLKIELSVVNNRSRRKVGLVKNIGGSLILLTPAIIFFWWFAIVVNDLISGSNVTGVQEVSLLMQIGYWSFCFFWGLSLTITIIRLLLEYFDKKDKVVSLTCKACDAAYVMFKKVEVSENELKPQEMIALISERSTPPSSINPKALPESPSMTKLKVELCSKCGGQIAGSELTCLNCGHTQWAVIGFMAVIAILIVGFVLVRAIRGTGSSLIYWGGGILGTILLMATIDSVIKATRGANSDPPAPEI